MQYDIIYIVDYRIHPNIWGGMDSFFETISKELTKNDIKHVFLFPMRKNSDESHYKQKNIPTTLLEGENILVSAINYCSTNNSKIIHCHFISTFTNKYRTLSKYTNFILTTEHMPRPINGWSKEKKIKSKINYYLSKKHITKLIHVSKYIEVENRCSFGEFGNKSIIIYNGVKINELERNFNIFNFNENPIKLISVGRLVEEKRFDRVIEISKILLDNGLNIQLNILGDGYLRKELETLAGKYLNKEIIFQGNVSNVYEWLRNSDLYIHCASQEAFAFVFLEAGEAGLPIIAFDVGGNREFIIDGFNGYLLESTSNNNEFVTKILNYIHNPQLLKVHGQNCRSLVVSSFSVEKMTNNYLNVYNEYLNA